jgi:hypothetical protein
VLLPTRGAISHDRGISFPQPATVACSYQSASARLRPRAYSTEVKHRRCGRSIVCVAAGRWRPIRSRSDGRKRHRRAAPRSTIPGP